MQWVPGVAAVPSACEGPRQAGLWRAPRGLNRTILSRRRPSPPGAARRCMLLAAADRAHEAVEAAFGHTEPRDLVVAEGHHVLVDFLEHGILGRVLLVHLGGLGIAGVHDGLREGLELGALRPQPAKRRRVLGVVLG